MRGLSNEKPVLQKPRSCPNYELVIHLTWFSDKQDAKQNRFHSLFTAEAKRKMLDMGNRPIFKN